MELDSSNSSDALLMNIFCHPTTLARSKVQGLMNLVVDGDPVFGFKPMIAMGGKKMDRTEIDLKIGDLLIEAKLTEYDFQRVPIRLVHQYRDLVDVITLEGLEQTDGTIESYQLIRGVLAVLASPGTRFCVICDGRRPDLIESWYRVMKAVRVAEVRSGLQILTWQELAATLDSSVQEFLSRKYGIETPGLYNT
jgi:hypothetical protein